MSRTKKIIYWVFTIWLGLGLTSTGVVQIIRAHDGAGAVDSLIHLGYPIYIITLLGVWKLLAVIALLIPKFPLLKEWAYAGCFFVTTGAIYSHLAVGEPATETLPAVLLLALTIVSWYVRPTNRTVVAAK
jgi:hypothetical protein